MTFIVNHKGVVQPKNLGREETARAGRITRFNPDAGWVRKVTP